MKRTAFSTITARLLFSFLMSAVFAIVIVLIFNQWIRQQLEAEADARLMASAISIEASIEQFNERNIQSLEMGARLPQLEDFIDASEEERANEDFRQDTINTLRSMQIAPWNQFYTLSFAILDIDGINILDTTSSNVGRDESRTPYFQHPQVTGLTATSDLYYIQSRSGVYYYYLVPIRRTVDPQPVIGLIRAEVSISAIQDLLLDLALEPAYSDVDILLFDEQMVRVVDSANRANLFRSIRDYTIEEVNLLTEAQLLPTMPASRLVQPIPSLVEALRGMNQSAVFSSVTEVNGAEQRVAAIRLEQGWYLVLAKSSELFYMPIQRQTQGIVLLSFLLMIGGLVISLLISRSVSVPIRQLTRVAELVAKGNLDVQAPVRSKDEIGSLAETFNKMTEELKHVKSNLEHLVEERTLSLKKANESLKHEMRERERLEAQSLNLALETERTRILSEFIQDASHEFKTPLSIINVKTHLLKRYTDEKLHRFLGDIEQQSHSIEKIVSAMVLMSKLDSMSDLALSPVYVDDFLKSVYELETVRFEQFQVLLKLELDAKAAAVAINSEMMREAMRQLLDNARSFTAPGEAVIIHSASNEHFVEIRIQDSGPGMSDEVLERAFERFYRGDEAHTTRGFGLGLPIVKRIIELSSGSIQIESKLNEGTSVIIRLPRSHDTPQSYKRMGTGEIKE